MAAEQRKKRLNAASVVGCTSQEQYKAKKKKLELPQYDSNMRSNISLEWDDKKKCVVAKSEQISIARRGLIQFIDSVPHCQNTLADIFDVPRETFDWENLSEVLSYEVWETHLSEKERKLLSQFLPKGAEAHKVVRELLAGDNFHFGNPFLNWGASLCSGNLHPDAVLHQEQHFKASKKAYYSELQKYHNDMIENLQFWKERWASCKDPVRETDQKIWSRSQKHAEKRMPTHANESALHDPDEDLAATSESCSWGADEKACSGDNLNLMMMHGETRRRKDIMEGKYDNSSDGLKVAARPRKGEKLHKRNIQCGDGAKYMSYIKVSKEQHQRVKNSMKHSSNSIQPGSPDNVLDNLNTFHVQPYEVFEEEEQQKLHGHWLQLAKRDLPAGFANWRRRQLAKWQFALSLGQEMEEKLKSLEEDDENENIHNMITEQTDNEASDLEPTITIEGEQKDKSDSLLQVQMDNGTTNHEPATTLKDEEKESPDCIFQEQMDNGAAKHELTVEDENISVPSSSQNQCLQQIALLSDSHQFRPMDLDSDDNHVMEKTDGFPPNVSEYPANLTHVDVPISQGGPLSSASDVWPAVRMPSAYYHSAPVSHGYASVRELSLGHPQVMEEQPAQLINLESDMREEDAGKDLLHRQSDDVSFFSPFPNQYRHQLLHSFFKGQGCLPYHNEQEQTRSDFQPAANVLMGTGHFPGHFREQLHPSMLLELRQKRLNDLYMHQIIQENVYSDLGRYSIPRKEHLSPLNIEDWAVNATHMSAPPQSQLNGGGSLSQNWFPGGHQSHVGWSGLEGAVGPNQSIGHGSTADQSLFSVLSQCNDLRSGAPYDSMGSTERFIQSGNYGGMGAGAPTTSNMHLRTANPLNYLSGHEATAGLKTNNIGWMSLPHQNTALHDSMGKAFLRSWNH